MSELIKVDKENYMALLGDLIVFYSGGKSMINFENRDWCKEELRKLEGDEGK